ncbi:MAG TPA: UPF0182 family protein [Gemmatimonadales bacterium]|nr:UPF0182 family protein [Gemmatimonadales bacterium]
MSPRALRIAFAIAILVAALFAGRWTAGLLAERWWAAQLSPAAVEFVTRWKVLSLVLESLGILVACSWFVGNLLLVYSAIGSVQVHRRLANLDILEAVNLRAIVWLSVAGGLLLGFITGRGMGEWTGDLMLAWTGVPYGQTEPLLGREVGFYLTRLPLWRLFHGYFLLLALTALGGVMALYGVIGAVRWVDRRPAINDHARRHLGGLAALLAIALAWGYFLEPFELVGGVNGSVHEGLFDFHRSVSFTLVILACAAALASVVWAWKGGTTLLAGCWGVLAGVSLLGHYLLPAVLPASAVPVLRNADRRQLDEVAYGMTAIRDTAFPRRAAPPDPPRPLAIWQATLAAEATASDSGRVVAADRAIVTVGRRARPAWLVIRDQAADGASISVLLDDQTTISGRPLLFRDADSLRTAKGVPTLRLPLRACWPRGPVSVVDTAAGGVEVGSGLRRVALAWALQSAELLGPTPPGARVFWHLDPVERLTRLAPFAVWGAPSPRLIGGELVWLLDGYFSGEAFPGSSRVEWRGESVGSLRAGLIGVVRAGTGVTSIYLRHTADDLAKQWRALSDSLIQPASAIPPEILRALPYPAELLEAQMRVLAEPHWGLGQLIGRGENIGTTGPLEEATWSPDTTGVQVYVPYERPQQRQVSATAWARVADGWEALSILRIDSLISLPDPSALSSRWEHFTTFQQLKDSVEKEGARLEPGPVRYWATSAGLGAYQPQFAKREGQEPVLAWVSIAVGDRRGAGHDAEEAWQNLLGLSAPIISAGARGSQLLEARRYLQAAEAALRRGDMEAFGRAWEGLRRTLKSP